MHQIDLLEIMFKMIVNHINRMAFKTLIIQLSIKCLKWRCPWCNDYRHDRGARGVMVIVVGNGHGDTSSNPR